MNLSHLAKSHLELVARAIEANPEEYDQGTWVRAGKACIAGHIVARARSWSMEQLEAFKHSARLVDIDQEAMNLLPIPVLLDRVAFARAMFCLDGFGWVEPYALYFREAEGDVRMRARIAAARIRHMIDKEE